MTNEIAIFAARLSVSPTVAWTLPAIFDKIANVSSRPVRSIINEATFRNRALGEYIATLAAQVAKEAK